MNFPKIENGSNIENGNNSVRIIVAGNWFLQITYTRNLECSFVFEGFGFWTWRRYQKYFSTTGGEDSGFVARIVNIFSNQSITSYN